MSEKTNRLIYETSPYLLQHAKNPVHWFPWNEEALNIARHEDKPIIVSIGYSACHWCHVMERESFENEDIASIMNEFFVNIKIDREERPDLDQIYMDAVQAMGVNGGWPLNVFLMPDGKPFYGGTYFPPQHWAQLLRQVATAFRKQRQELADSAEDFAKAINTSEIKKYALNVDNHNFNIENLKQDLKQGFQKLAESFDKQEGGVGDAPKFPMPSIYAFLMRYAQVTENVEAMQQTELTLRAMAFGGIYDQIGGGFARYSTDNQWFAPHFEKMLYDNAQLLSVYSEAFLLTKNPLYQNVVFETVDFIERELTAEEGGFYSALDADSEGEEGKFYVWEYEELQQIFTDSEIELFYAYFNIEPSGNWEKNYNILHRKVSDEVFAGKHTISLEALQNQVESWKKVLFEIQKKRIKPSLDDKILSGWNGLTIKGLSESYAIFEYPKFLHLAQRNADFMIENMMQENRLFRSYKNGQSRFFGCLEDYACVIEGLIALYQVCFEEKYLKIAKQLTEYTLENFYEEEEGFFFYTDKTGEELIAQKKEIFDNVIPASNSVMAKNLHRLGLFFDQPNYTKIAQEMVSKMLKLIRLEVRYVSNWASLLTDMLEPTPEIVIVGRDYQKFALELQKSYIPNKIICATDSASTLPLFENRLVNLDQTTIYVCHNKTCQLPVHSVKEAMEMIK